MVVYSNSPDETYNIGKQLGLRAQSGELYCLVGDLGVGKTIFTKGFASGLNILEAITSPTFTIVNIYEEGRYPFFHFDVYRIEHISEMDEIGYEEYFYGKGITFVEWANLIEPIIPKKAHWISIEKDLEKGFDYRKITLSEGL